MAKRLQNRRKALRVPVDRPTRPAAVLALPAHSLDLQASVKPASKPVVKGFDPASHPPALALAPGRGAEMS